MTKLRTVAMTGALLLGGSALALAQTSSTTTTMPSTTTTTMPSNTMSPTVTPPAGGSHPTMATPTTGSTTGSAVTTAPGPQSAMKTDQDVMKQLQSAGYSDVTDVKPGKSGHTASAMKNGKRVTVDIDANGKIETMH